MQVSFCLALHKLFLSTARRTWKKNSPLFWALPHLPRNPWNSILQPRLEMSCCNHISDPSPLGSCQCFRERQDHSINHLDNCSTLYRIPYSAGLQCRAVTQPPVQLCYVCDGQSLPHVARKLCFSTLEKMFLKCRTLYQYPLASSFTHDDIQENSSAFS